MEILLMICFALGLVRGMRILRETHAGQRPGVTSKDKDVWVFLGDGW